MTELDATLTRCYHILEQEPADKEEAEYCCCATQIRKLQEAK